MTFAVNEYSMQINVLLNWVELAERDENTYHESHCFNNARDFQLAFHPNVNIEMSLQRFLEN